MQQSNRGVVYVVAKAPLPGTSKTRLCPPLRLDEAAALAAAFLLDTVAMVRRAGAVPRAICRDAGEQALLRRLFGRAARVSVQAGQGLGAALESAFCAGFGDGFRAVGVIGADTPTLPSAVIRRAFAAVAGGADVALGPSDDGGYYLLVARDLYGGLFRDMAWSTATVAEETLARCRALGLRAQVLAGWYDIDDAAALGRLEAELAAGPPDLAPHTRAALAAALRLRA